MGQKRRQGGGAAYRISSPPSLRRGRHANDRAWGRCSLLLRRPPRYANDRAWGRCSLLLRRPPRYANDRVWGRCNPARRTPRRPHASARDAHGRA
eukprot:scaffold8033_cov114-Isochrysis_galbana.AAC.2